MRSLLFRLTFFICLLYNSTFCIAQSGIITTIAGTGSPAYSGDSAAAVYAGIDDPGKVIADAAGNIYFSDVANNVVRKINTSGIITTIAGTGIAGSIGDGGLATSARLYKPYGLALDDTGNLYIADFYNHRIRKVNTSGIITTVAGNGTPSFGGDGAAATSANLWYPNYIFVDHGGNLFISDNQNQRIRKVNTSGIISTVVGTGAATYGGDGGLATAAQIKSPAGIWVDSFGSIYIADFGNSRIRKVNTSGIISTIAGTGSPAYSGDGGLATVANINMPLDIVMDTANNIYIADGYNNRIRKIDATGVISLVAGNGTGGYSGDGMLATTAEFYTPDGLWVDNAGNILIADAYNNRVRKISFNNHPPHFTGGLMQSMNICENSSLNSIDSQLAVLDTDAGQTETWTLIDPPAHGTAVITYSVTSTGGILTPVGLSYTPFSGFAGTDAIKVGVNDGFASDVTEIDFTIDSLPDVGIISGNDSVCPDHQDTLSESITGGTWASSNSTISIIGLSGIVTGMSPGYDTIIYTTTNSCGNQSTIFPVQVLYGCPTEVNSLSTSGEGIDVFPSPAVNGSFTANVLAKSNEPVAFTITNIVGQTLKEFTGITNKPMDIKLDAAPGLYFISAITGDKKWSKKLVISN